MSVKTSLVHGVGHSWLSLDLALTLQPLRHGMCKDSDVMLRGHQG